MAVATRTLKDTVVNAPKAGGKVTVLVTFDDETSSNNTILDASGLDGHANGAKLDILRLWWGINNGVSDDDKNFMFIEFKGASSDTLAINLAGTGHYDGTAGPITNNATNTGATSGDLEASFRGASGFVIIELRKDENFTS
tara:strand:- start:215 stop:637 length:423 start_codon:yes stop_codon:yes gene_type:complete